MRTLCWLAFVVAFSLSGCQTADPGMNSAALVRQGAVLVPSARIPSVFANRTAYVRFVQDYLSSRAGQTWVEYYEPNGNYYYKDSDFSFRGKWVSENDQLCFIQNGKSFCTKVYDLNGSYYFVYLNAGRYYEQAIGSTTRMTEGDVEGLKESVRF
jgi:hypothetical protein